MSWIHGIEIVLWVKAKAQVFPFFVQNTDGVVDRFNIFHQLTQRIANQDKPHHDLPERIAGRSQVPLMIAALFVNDRWDLGRNVIIT